MANEIEKFDPSKLMDGVKDRIKATFVSLIPDDIWNSMVEKEIYVFTTGKIIGRNEVDYNQKDENGNYVIKFWEERIPYKNFGIKDSWGNIKKDEMSPLQQMIQEELRAKFKEDLHNYLNSDAYKATFTEYGERQISEKIEEILINNSSQIFRSIIGNMMQDVVNYMRCSCVNYSQ